MWKSLWENIRQIWVLSYMWPSLKNESMAYLLLYKSIQFCPSPCENQYPFTSYGNNQFQMTQDPPVLGSPHLCSAVTLTLSLVFISWVCQIYMQKWEVYGTKFVREPEALPHQVHLLPRSFPRWALPKVFSNLTILIKKSSCDQDNFICLSLARSAHLNQTHRVFMKHLYMIQHCTVYKWNGGNYFSHGKLKNLTRNRGSYKIKSYIVPFKLPMPWEFII
jgi:hypothetical protein